jgi:hypothetical protein
VHEAHLRAAAAELERRYDGLAVEPYLIALTDAQLSVAGVSR